MTETVVDPKDYEREYKSLFDIYTVQRNERANITKQDIQKLFNIPYMNVMYEDDEEEKDQNKESLKKPKKKEDTSLKKSSRKKEFDKKQIN